MKRWLTKHGLTTDWVAYAIGLALVAGLFCPYLTGTQ